MVNEYEIKKQICEIGKRIYNRNMVAANDGNISVKLNDNEFLCTPTGVSKGFMTPEYICKVDAKGNVIQANPGFRPSSEIKMHMRVYQKRPDVGSVVHAHPVYATSFAIAGIPLTQLSMVLHLPMRFRIDLRNIFHIMMQFFLRAMAHLPGQQTFLLHT